MESIKYACDEKWYGRIRGMRKQESGYRMTEASK